MSTTTPPPSDPGPRGRTLQVSLIILVIGGLFLAAIWLHRDNRPSLPSAPPEKPKPARRKFKPTALAAEAKDVALKVVSALDGAPVGDALVQYAEEPLVPGTAIRESRTDPSGRALLSIEGRGGMAITAPGYVPLRGRLTFKKGEYVVPMTPTGGVELTFSRPSAEPVPDVDVELIPSAPEPPMVELEEVVEMPELLVKDIEWKSRSGSDGAARWKGLPPGLEYQWHVLSPVLVEDLDAPAPPGQRIEVTRRGFAIEDDGHPRKAGFSGSFQVQPGQVTRLKARVLVGASVVGALPLSQAAAAKNALVKIFHRKDYTAPTGSRMVAYDLDGQMKPDPSGEFRFLALRPGMKRVTAYWRQGDTHFHFSHVNFELLPAETKNLGTMTATTGSTVNALVRIEGEEFLPPEARNREFRAFVGMTNAPPKPHGPGLTISHLFDVPIGRPFFLHGLMDGDLMLDAQLGFEVPAVEGLQWENQPVVEHRVPGVSNAVLILRVKSSVQVEIMVRAGGGAAPSPARVVLLPEKAGLKPVEILGLQPGIPKKATVAAGRYSALAFSDGFAGSTDNLFGRGAAEILAGRVNKLQLDLSEGAVVKGRALDSDGNPTDTIVHFGIDPFGETPIYRSKTDARGNFILRGVPPGTVLKPIGFQGKVQAGSVGEQTAIELRRNR